MELLESLGTPWELSSRRCLRLVDLCQLHIALHGVRHVLAEARHVLLRLGHCLCCPSLFKRRPLLLNPGFEHWSTLGIKVEFARGDKAVSIHRFNVVCDNDFGGSR